MGEGSNFMNRPIRKGAAIISALGLITGGCTSEESAPETCRSPATESSIYPGDPEANPDVWSSWKTGVLITTTLHPAAEGLVVSFGKPNTSYWDGTSKVIVPSRAGKVALRIGKGDVVMATQAVADMGSVACDKPPDSLFSPAQEFVKLLEQNATLPAFP
jgi:hypothetical protein